MKKLPICSPADPYTLAPLTALLPIEGSVRRLEALSSSLYARLEKVQGLQRDGSADAAQTRRFNAEIAMLRQILEWLAAHKNDADPGVEEN